jgi:methionyl-tRNA formyltransferase
MRIVLWVGNEPNQVALANKIHNRFPLTAIVVESRRHKKKLTVRKITEKVIEKILLNKISAAWFGMLDYYNTRYPSFPKVNMLDVENINSQEVFEFTIKERPELVIVSGTRLIRKKLLSIKPSIGIINLHTGLSPYIKGGPNCTNWCIATGQYHLIGNTIMWINEGIDTGNILTTEFSSFTGNEDLKELHIKVMEHAHDLYVRSIEALEAGNFTNVPQDSIAQGITYYTREWGLKQKMALVKNIKKFRKALVSGNVTKEREKIRTVKL